MFSQKQFVIFISKRYIDPGVVTIGKEISFDGGEAFQYTEETLVDVLERVQELSKGKVRIVLGEELVYVTELSFPSGIYITRELVLEKAEQSIPENLRKTDWDFQTLRYTEKSVDAKEALVQVAVVEKSFSEIFRKAFDKHPFPIEGIFPESYVLANFEKETGGTSIIVERDREITTICAVESGFVIATRVEVGSITVDMLKEFISFLFVYKGKKAGRIVFSHFLSSAFKPFMDLSEEGCEIIAKDYNPLVGVALLEKISGKDEEVLNINIFSSSEKKPWWKVF